MSPVAQRLAIGLACGLKCNSCKGTGIIPPYPADKWAKATKQFPETFPEIQPVNYCGHIFFPNYLSDLNACHEMEKTLDNIRNAIPEDKGFDTERGFYIAKLEDVISESCAEDDIYENLISATAPQRCEAFLKVKGLWKD